MDSLLSQLLQFIRQFSLQASGWTESLANLTIKAILLAVGVLLVLIGLLRWFNVRYRNFTEIWMENVQVILSVVVVVFLMIRPFLFQAFYIPSESMVPTLMGPRTLPLAPGGSLVRDVPGDRLLVNKLLYRLGHPSRFDIAVFKAPPRASADEKEYIKRVIGLPGETVEVVPPRILVDGKTVVRLTSEMSDPEDLPSLRVDRASLPIAVSANSANISSLLNSYPPAALRIVAAPSPRLVVEAHRVEVDGKVELTDDGGRIQQVDGAMGYGAEAGVQATSFTIDGEVRLIVVTGKTLTYDSGHVRVNNQRLVEPYLAEPPAYAKGPVQLGVREYWMMGDNRNNSNDSHSWGPLERWRIIGRAEVLFWPVDRVRVMHWWLLAAMLGLFVGWNGIQRLLLGPHLEEPMERYQAAAEPPPPVVDPTIGLTQAAESVASVSPDPTQTLDLPSPPDLSVVSDLPNPWDPSVPLAPSGIQDQSPLAVEASVDGWDLLGADVTSVPIPEPALHQNGVDPPVQANEPALEPALDLDADPSPQLDSQIVLEADPEVVQTLAPEMGADAVPDLLSAPPVLPDFALEPAPEIGLPLEPEEAAEELVASGAASPLPAETVAGT